MKKDSIALVKEISQSRESGISDREIIEGLRDQGYKNQEILEALKKADLKSASGASMEPAYEEEEVMEKPQKQIDTKEVEVLVEKIVEEKWESVEKEMDVIRKWKEDFSTTTDLLDKKMGDINTTLDLFKKSMVEKVNSYSEGVQDVSSDIQAMDMVFKKILPELTGSVKELSSLVGKLKK